MLQIRTTGVEDYLDGSANIKALIIGGPNVGKTRMASFWPKPIFLDCENSRGSLTDRNMPYVEINNSKDMLDALAYLKGLEKTPKPERQFQTVVVDTADSFQRKVKDEWLQQTGQGVFTGFDAWGFLDTKMQMLFTRLLNLDYNVLVNVHYKDKQFKDGDNNVREFTLQLQGNIGDIIFNDFGLVGWLGTYWKDKEQHRGLTFRPTTDKPFLKDRFNVTPKWIPIEFTDDDYNALFRAFFDNENFENLRESQTVGEIGDAEIDTPANVNPPGEGGPVQPKPSVGSNTSAQNTNSAEQQGPVPLEKRNKPDLQHIGEQYGLKFKANTLKSEMVDAIKEAKAKAEQGTQEQEPAGRGGNPAPEVAAGDQHPSEPAPTPEPSDDGSSDKTDDATPASEESERTDVADGSAEVNKETGEIDPETLVQDQLGGEKVAEEPAEDPMSVDDDDAAAEAKQKSQPQPPQPTSKPGPTNCADCGADLTEAWNDPARRDYIRLSYVKFRRHLCTEKCYPAAVAAK